MGFSNYTEMSNSWDAGRVWRQHIHKTATPVLTGVGYWGDMSMAAGTPKYNAYVGNQYEFTAMEGSSNFGINTGIANIAAWSAATTYAAGTSVLIFATQDIYISLQAGNINKDPTSEPTWWELVGKGNKYLSRMALGGSGAANTAFPANVMLCDYAGFYPLVDMDSTDYQPFINNSDDPLIDAVPRHTSGLQLMIVCTTPQGTVTPIQGLINYTDSAGVANVASFYAQAATVGQINNFCTSTANNTGSMPFVNLGPTSYDVQTIQGVTMTNSCGGFAAFVLVKPLVAVTIPDIITPYEIDFPIRKAPATEVLSGAYLNMIYQPTSAGTATGVIRGSFAFIRSS